MLLIQQTRQHSPQIAIMLSMLVKLYKTCCSDSAETKPTEALRLRDGPVPVEGGQQVLLRPPGGAHTAQQERPDRGQGEGPQGRLEGMLLLHGGASGNH